jgi:hypothetical protein
MSSREASIGRSAKRKQEKIEQRRKEYENQKLIDGIYCVITRIESSTLEQEDQNDFSEKRFSGWNFETFETSSVDTQSLSVNSILEQSPSPSIYSVQNNKQPMEDKLSFVSPMSSVNFTPKTDVKLKDLQMNVVHADTCLKYYVIDHEGCIFGSQSSKSKLVRLVFKYFNLIMEIGPSFDN